MTHLNPDLRVTHYRWRNDNGSESAATYKENEDTATTLPFASLDTNIRLRFVVQENNGDNTNSNTFQLQYNVDGAGFNDVTGASSNIRASASGNLTDDEVTSDGSALSGTGTFVAGRVDEADGATTTGITLSQTNHTEIEYCFQARSADLSGGETITFQLVSSNDSIDAHDVTATLNIGTGSVTVTPGAATAVASSVAPTTVLGSLSITPSAATAVASKVDPTVSIGTGPSFDVRVVRAIITTSGTTQDITVSGFGTPDAAYVICNSADQDEGPIIGSGIWVSQSWGFTDGTNSRCVISRWQDGVTTTDNDSESANSLGGHTTDTPTFEYIGFSQWITDGIRITKGPPSRAFSATIILFRSSNQAFAVGTVDANANVSGLSFPPNFVFGAMIDATSHPATSSACRFGIGAAYDNGTSTEYGSQGAAHQSGQTTTAPNGEYQTQYYTCISSTATQPGLSISAWNSDGWTNSGVNRSTEKVHYLAMQLPTGFSANISSRTAPTSTGNSDITSLGFDPGFLMIFGTSATSDDFYTAAGNNQMFEWGATDGVSEYVQSTGYEDNVSTTNAWFASVSDACYQQYDHSGATLENEASFVSWLSGGYRLNHTTVTSGSTQKFTVIAFEATQATAGGVTVAPAAATAVAASVAPTTILGSLSLAPSASTAVAASVNPTVVQGSLSITPTAAAAVAASVDPTVVAGSLSITPTAAAAVAASVDPSVVQASMTVTPAVSSAVAATVDPTTLQGSLSITPATSNAVAATVNPTVVQGSLSIAPTASAAVAATVDPTVQITGGDVTVAPTAATAVAASVDPTTVLGSISYTPTASSAVAAAIAPTVVQGSLLITPAASSAVAASVAPSVVQSALTLTPAASSSIAASINPTTVLGSLSITPSVSSAVAVSIDPTVVQGSLSIAPTASSAVAATVDPAVISGGDVTITPAASSAIAVSVAPTTVLGSLTITPAVSSAVAASVDPIVVKGSLIISPAVSSAVAASIAPSVIAGSLSLTPTAAASIAVTIDPTVSIGSIFTFVDFEATVGGDAFVAHACAYRDIPDVESNQETIGTWWGDQDSGMLPWDDPSWPSYVRNFSACLHGEAQIGGDVVTKTGRASITGDATVTQADAEESIASSGTVYILEWSA